MNDAIERIEEARPRRFRRYPKYKDSGIEWLGEIPAHWEVKALKRPFRVVNGSTPKSSEPDNWDGDIPWVTPDDLGKMSERVLNESARYITRKGYDSCGHTDGMCRQPNPFYPRTNRSSCNFRYVPYVLIRVADHSCSGIPVTRPTSTFTSMRQDQYLRQQVKVAHSGNLRTRTSSQLLFPYRL